MSVNWGELSAVVSVLSVVFFAGAWWQSSKHNKETIETIKESFKESISTLEKNFQEKVESMKESFNTTIQGLKDTIEQNTKHTTEQIKNLEIKQDKHNSVIERTVAVEASAKSAHKRLDEGEEHFKELSENVDFVRNFLIERGIK